MKNIIKNFSVCICLILAIIYLVFLITPFFIGKIANKYIPQIQDEVKKSTGLTLEIERIKPVTNYRFNIGADIINLSLKMPDGENILTADKAGARLALFPLIFRQAELREIFTDNIYLNLGIENGGKFSFEKVLPQSNVAETSSHTVDLPFGLKLSNNLPDIKLNGYNLKFADLTKNKDYSIKGNYIRVSDFTLDKKVSLKADGQVILDGKNHLNYDIKLNNRIMPDININDIIFEPVNETGSKESEINIGKIVIDIFEGLSKNEITANLNADLKTFGSVGDMNIIGKADIDNIGINVYGKPLPKGFAKFVFKNNKTLLNSKIFTSDNDFTMIDGQFNTGKRPKIDLSVKSDADLSDVVSLFDSILKSFNCKELDTLKASGKLNADFKMQSDFKKINSDGYAKLDNGQLNYGLYNISINDIHSNIDLTSNNLRINDTGFNISGQPLKMYGEIKENSVCNLHVIAEKLQLKGLLLAFGQAGILKENDIISGLISANISISGELSKLVPDIKIIADNINIKNKPSDTRITLDNSNVKLNTDGKIFSGNADIKGVALINPLAVVKSPDSKVTFGEKDIVIDKGSIYLNNSKIDVKGKITDYASDKIKINVSANGNIISSDIKSMIPKELGLDVMAKGSMPVSVNLTGNGKKQNISAQLKATPQGYVSLIGVENLNGHSTIINSDVTIADNSLKLSQTGIFVDNLNNPVVKVTGGISDLSGKQILNSINVVTPNDIVISIPGFKTSNAKTKFNLNLNGRLEAPELKGNFIFPYMKIPSLLFEAKDTSVNISSKDLAVFDGDIDISEIKSGEIIANDIKSPFYMKNNIVYLKDLNLKAYGGTMNGKVNYNLSNAQTALDVRGSGMNAIKAIEACAGIKNALSGTLGFGANLTLNAADEKTMMQTLKGKVDFAINDGAFLNIGTLQSFLNAQNILKNPLLKAAIDSVTYLQPIKNTANFKSLTGDILLSNGWASLNSVKSQGNSLSYYITGKYNLLNGNSSIIFLGRLDEDIIALLGPVGNLSVNKLTSYIPKFGELTGQMINAITSNPDNEKTSLIPELLSGSKNYKDFKVEMIGLLGSPSAVKSFKWLTVCDTSEIDVLSVKEQVKTTTTAVKDAYKNQIQEAKNTIEKTKQEVKNKVEAVRQEANTQAEQTQNIRKNLKNIQTLQDLLKNNGASMGTGN